MAGFYRRDSSCITFDCSLRHYQACKNKSHWVPCSVFADTFLRIVLKNITLLPLPCSVLWGCELGASVTGRFIIQIGEHLVLLLRLSNEVINSERNKKRRQLNNLCLL